MLVFCNTSKRKLSFTFRRGDVLTALTPRPLRRSIVTVLIPRPRGSGRFKRLRPGTHVILQGRQIAFERPCRHPRAPRPELSGEVRNCHLSASNRSSDAINDLLNSLGMWPTDVALYFSRCAISLRPFSRSQILAA